MEDARVLPHDAEVLVLSDLVDPQVVALGESDLVLLLCRLGSELTWIGSHREVSGWDVGQLESDVRCHALGWWQRSAAGTADCGNQEQNEG